ncbi:caspase domain-containing protein [Suillus subalutaceus]|uniref:caspase domain-containing protein n=1 Tax=Suillus subalutaceus TaxID=48586 RepID=UPI001B871FBF|nr:caspase domain-containing protein [Suillus subalutaceus]KAG1830711.1 caspase domain-containing protein [Suillus subalutaceus]
MLPEVIEIDDNSFPAALTSFIRITTHAITSMDVRFVEAIKDPKTNVLKEITVQGHHHLAEFSRCPRSSGAPYLNRRVSEASYIPMYTQPSPRSPGRKRGIVGQRYELRGCNNDIHNLSPCLINQWGYDPTDIVQLIDDGCGPLPTKHNILLEMRRLAFYARAGDSMFFYFSGHGGQVRDLDGDEVDGYDECRTQGLIRKVTVDVHKVICPVDYQQSGVINDDEIHEIMSLIERPQVKPLAAGSRLTALFDYLPYLYDSRQCKCTDGVTPDARIRKHSQAKKL